MNREEQVEKLTTYIAHFTDYIGKHLPDDVKAKISELAEAETNPLAKSIYETMNLNQRLASELNRPSCQDTGVIQFWVKCGTKFPLIYVYMAGGGCTLPGKAMVLMPGAGYEGVAKFVLDVMTSYGLNACPPLLVGVGVATSVETAALLSKKALMRPIGSHNENERAAKMEALLEKGINDIGLGPQGMGGKASVMGVNIENTARHPSAIGVAVNVGCWSHRRGHIIFDKDLNYTITTHSEVTL